MLLQSPQQSTATATYPKLLEGAAASQIGRHATPRGMGVYCGHFFPQFWPEHDCKQHQLLLLLDEDTDGEITWRKHGNKTFSQRLIGQHFIFIEAGTACSLRWDNEADLVCLSLSDDFAARLALKNVWHGLHIRRFHELAKGDLVVWCLACILKNLCAPDALRAAQFYVEAVGTVLATHLLRRKKLEQLQAETPVGLNARQATQVRAYIHEHLREPMRVHALARSAGISKDHFIKLFKNTIGMTPHRYILIKRVQLAQELINKGGMRNSEIAVESGFCDQSHMSRCFRKLCAELARENTRPNGFPKTR